MKTISARSLWIKLLTTRMKTGEPYLLFIDHVNENIPKHQKLHKLWVQTSNLCTEITLPTGEDYLGKERTAVCCLSSLNLEKYLEWESHPTFIEDVMRFLDNVLSHFIQEAPPLYEAGSILCLSGAICGSRGYGSTCLFPKARNSLGKCRGQVLEQKDFCSHPWPSLRGVPKISSRARPLPDAAVFGIQERFSNKIAIAAHWHLFPLSAVVRPRVLNPLSAMLIPIKPLADPFSCAIPCWRSFSAKKGLEYVWDMVFHCAERRIHPTSGSVDRLWKEYF